MKEIKFILLLRHPDGREYSIEEKDDTSIWISDNTGEGGEFKSKDFFEIVDKFYKENF